MNPEEVLSQLETLLETEQEALINIDLEKVVALGARKAELLLELELVLDQGEEALPPDSATLARRVQQQARTNRFLLRHLRSCLTVVDPTAAPTTTYGRDGRAQEAAGLGGMVRTRL